VDAVFDLLQRSVEQLLGRASGPLHLRLLMMPTVVSVITVRAAFREAREQALAARPSMPSRADARPHTLRGLSQDIGRVVVMACILDSAYQVFVLGTFRPLQLVIVVVATAVLPYVLLLPPLSLLARIVVRRESAPGANPADPGNQAES
jgi:hypothetical protein